MKRQVLIMSGVALAALLTGCGGGGDGGGGTAATLQSITIAPANPSVAAGVTRQFTANGTYSDGTTKDVSASVTWSSATTTVASIGTTGLATGVAAGTSVISATSGTITSSMTLTVTPATLQAIAVTPENPSVPKGLTRQLTATGTYSDGTSQDITTTVTWNSASASVATVSASGLSSGLAAGTSIIKATSGAISGTTALIVTSAALQSIAVTPAAISIPKGITQQYTATGTYSDGSLQDVTASVAWTTAVPGVAGVAVSGMTTGMGDGVSSIIATSGTVTGNTSIMVTPATLQSIVVTPSTPAVANGLTQQLTATGNYSDGTSQNLTTSVTWTSLATPVATVNANGLVSGIGVGTAGIGAALGLVSGNNTVTVTAAKLQSISVTPAGASLAKGLTEQMFAIGTYSDGSIADISGVVAWTSLPVGIAPVSGVLATATAVGTATINAQVGSIAGSTALNVTPATVVAIQISNPPPSIGVGTSVQLIANCILSDGTQLPGCNASLTWLSYYTSIAAVNAAGTVTGLAPGMAVIRASMKGAATLVSIPVM